MPGVRRDVGPPRGTSAARPKHFRRPEVGDLTLVIEVVRFGDDGQRMTVYQAEPGSADEAALGTLAAR